MRKRRPGLPLALVALLLAARAWAASVTVEVGKTTTLDVGYARGLNCDDLKVADVEIRASTTQTNELVITGLKPGRTVCRAGQPSTGPTTLVTIIVVEKGD